MTIALMGGSIDTALSASQRALTLNPSGFSALMHNGWIQCAAGNPGAAIEPFTRALRLSRATHFGVTASWDWQSLIATSGTQRSPWIGRVGRFCLPTAVSGRVSGSSGGFS
jgi:hypothetical protein